MTTELREDRGSLFPLTANPARGPRVSVVLTTGAGLGHLLSMINDLEERYRSSNVELVVVRAGPPRLARALRKVCPGVRFIVQPPGTPLHELRRAGMRAVTGDTVMLLDDTPRTDRAEADIASIGAPSEVSPARGIST